ncbi:MAG: magnesium transporter [Chromatiales bacterium]|nr:magnesium transporter [Chromatiales bacterium]
MTATNEYLSQILRSGKVEQVRTQLHNLHAGEIANLLESLPIPERRIVWKLTNVELEGDILLEVSEEVRKNLIELTQDKELLLATEGLEIDDLADLIDTLPDTVTDQLLAGMDAQNRRRLEHVLSYDADTAGGLMNPDILTLRMNITVDVAVRYIRMKKSLPQHTDSLVIVDHTNRYLGVITITDLITHSKDTLLSDLVNTEITAIPVSLPSNEVVALFEDRDLLSIAVVDANYQVVGRITVDDVLDVLRNEPLKERIGFSGASGEEDLYAPVFSSSRKRALWLGINLLTAFIAAWFISLFEDTLKQIIILAILVPVVCSMGGIAGSQSLMITIRGLATKRLTMGYPSTLLNKEVLVGFLNGGFWAVVVAFVTILWVDSISIGIIIGAAIIINLVCAAAIGVLIPILLKKLGVDPALAGSVILTTITDIVGVVVFLGLATFFLIG